VARLPRIVLRAAPIAALLAGAAVASAASPTIHASPSTIKRGHVLHVFGGVPGCQGSVTLLSKAFLRIHSFAGVSARFAALHGTARTYSIHVTVPKQRHPGAYTITGRCGGGNIGVVRTIHVTA
jgi:hypothetical protein